MKIGTKIRIARESKRYSQEKIADILNISQSKYCRFENNKTFIDWNSLPLLAKTLDLNISDLFPNENQNLVCNKSNNQNRNTENINYDQVIIKKIEELYNKIIEDKELYYNKIIEEKNKIIESLIK